MALNGGGPVDREVWKADDSNRDRALEVLRFLYRDDHSKIMAEYAAHRDLCEYNRIAQYPLTDTAYQLAFISTKISYGLFLADHQILNLLGSELVILPAI